MNELKPRIHADQTGLDYVLAGDYYIPDIELPGRAGCESFSELAQIPSGIPMEPKKCRSNPRGGGWKNRTGRYTF